MIRRRSDLGQMRDAHHLMPFSQQLQHASDDFRDPPADSCVHLVENQRRDLRNPARDGLNGETDAREFTTRRHPGKRLRRHPLVCGHQQ